MLSQLGTNIISNDTHYVSMWPASYQDKYDMARELDTSPLEADCHLR